MRHADRSNEAFRPWALPLLLGCVCAVLAIAASGDPRWHRLLDYSRAAIGAGEGWRLATGHLMHWSGAHAALDLGALVLVAWIFATTLGPGRQATTSLAAVAVVDAALWTLHPSLERYVGLSGVLHAWFAAGAVLWTVGPDAAARRWGAALLAGLIVKLALEANGIAFWLGGADFPVATAAHRWGALAGGGCGVGFGWFSRGSDRAAAAAASRGR